MMQNYVQNLHYIHTMKQGSLMVYYPSLHNSSMPLNAPYVSQCALSALSPQNLSFSHSTCIRYAPCNTSFQCLLQPFHSPANPSHLLRNPFMLFSDPLLPISETPCPFCSSGAPSNPFISHLNFHLTLSCNFQATVAPSFP